MLQQQYSVIHIQTDHLWLDAITGADPKVRFLDENTNPGLALLKFLEVLLMSEWILVAKKFKIMPLSDFFRRCQVDFSQIMTYG